MKKYLEIWRLAKTFPTPKGPAVIVRDFDLTIEQGEFVCLIGHSGCGKSTVLSMVAGLTQKTDGDIVLAGREVTSPGIDRGVVFQAPCLFDWMTALDNVLIGVEQAFPKLTRAERTKIAEEQLDLVGLGDAFHKRPAELSQGMRQRVGLARAFALKPKMLLLDEPFGMLDSLTRLELQGVLMDLWSKQRITALMVTHDVDEALYLADRVAMMTSGPAATLGAVLEVPFARPRDRSEYDEQPGYEPLRERVLDFLESQQHRPPEETKREAVSPAAAPDLVLAGE
ncbi:MAG TPA: ABC transporter ATP-binding protein [Polyangiaceae bacterium]